jgi:tetratricopeptide (TPR) repeat protein
LAWILTLTTEAGTELDGPDQQFWIATLNTELDNIRGAFDWGLSGGDAATALKAASQIPRYWWLTSQIAEGAEWLERLLRTAVDAPQAVRARGLSGSGFLINMLGRPGEAEARLREAVALLREGDDGVALAWALNFLGRAAWDSEDATTLRRYQQEAAELFADNGIGQGVFLARIMETAVVAFLEQDAPTSVEMSKQLIVMAEQVGAPNALAHAHESVAWAGSHAEQAPDALAAYRKALPFYRDLGNRDCACHCLSGVAHSLALTGRTRDAAELIGVVDALLESLSVVPPGYERVLYYRAREALGNSEPQARRQGRNVEFDTAIDLALELIG